MRQIKLIKDISPKTPLYKIITTIIKEALRIPTWNREVSKQNQIIHETNGSNHKIATGVPILYTKTSIDSNAISVLNQDLSPCSDYFFVFIL